MIHIWCLDHEDWEGAMRTSTGEEGVVVSYQLDRISAYSKADVLAAVALFGSSPSWPWRSGAP
jgi:hypothetical protein